MKYLLIKLLLFPSLVFAQASIRGIIINEAKEPMPLTNVVLVNKSTGTITNEQGRFVLENIAETDSVKITNIAYKSVIIAFKNLSQNDTVVLSRNEISLDEIIVGDLSKYQQEQTLGFANYPAKGSFSLLPGNQIALYIANEKIIIGHVKGIYFQLKDIGKCRNSMRLRLLKLDTLTSLPANDILKENILLQSSDLSRDNYIDLSKYKIMFPYEGVVVLLEWVFPDNLCNKNAYPTVSANLLVPNNLIWLNYRDGVWKKNNRPRLPNGNFMTPNIGIKVGF